jgi:hypothetical protein
LIGVSYRVETIDPRGKWTRTGRPLLLLLLVFLLSNQASAQDAEAERDHTYVQMGGYIHFSSREEHDGPPVLVAVERSRPSNYYYGLALFNNSFNQFSQFLYFGREFPWQRVHENFRFRLSFGLVHGYRDEFEDELPLNYKGFSLGLVPSIGFRRNRVGFDLALLANAGLMLSVGYEF